MVEITRDDLDVTRTHLTDTRDTLLRLKTRLELADMGKETNVALKAYGSVEQQIVDGDLSLLKDAAGSELKMDQIADIYDRLLPQGTLLSEEQQRFERALDTTMNATARGRATKQKDPARITVETHPLPHRFWAAMSARVPSNRMSSRVCGHSGFPLGLISDSNFQNGTLNERATVCGVGHLVAAA